MGDACDPDDDNDGYSDGREINGGSDPLDPDSVPTRPLFPTEALKLLLE